jgi:leader peptidase (prepilin peptidase)/N-methyltransferase
MAFGTDAITLTGLALAGAAFGSFAMLVADRMAAGEGWVAGRSRCDGCGRTLSAAQLLPLLSYAAAGGRARCCGVRIAVALPVAEAAGAAVPLWAAAAAPEPVLVLVSCALGWALLALSLIDLSTLRLPDAITVPLLAAGLGLAAAGLTGDIAAHALGAAAGWASVAAAAAFWRRWRGVEGIGMGDAKLLAAAGAWVGIGGLSGVALWACALGLAGAAATALRRGDWRAPAPFGPPLAAGLWLSWLHGAPSFA